MSLPTRLLTKAEAAELLRVTERTLDYWAADGRGPPRTRIGKRGVRYPLPLLAAWIAVCTDTGPSELAEGRN